MELDSRHGREVIGVLLFQDIAVVPLLILLPALSRPAEEMFEKPGLAAVKVVFLLSLVLVFGQRLMRWWFTVDGAAALGRALHAQRAADHPSAGVVVRAGRLSLALGAFVAGMLISETEYRYQVEGHQAPSATCCSGLFFCHRGMLLDVAEIVLNLPAVLGLLAALLV